jgi:hypothetical protein
VNTIYGEDGKLILFTTEQLIEMLFIKEREKTRPTSSWI